MLIPGVGMTFKQVIKNLEKLESIPIKDMKEEIIDAFNGYCFRGDVEEIIGFDEWPELKVNGKYEICVRQDHEDAYELTLHIDLEDSKITVNNVL